MSEMSGDQNKSQQIVKAIEEIEKFFFNEKEGELYKFLLTAIEKPLLENILHRTEGNQLKAAKILGINRNTLRTKIRKLNIDISRFRPS